MERCRVLGQVCGGATQPGLELQPFCNRVALSSRSLPLSLLLWPRITPNLANRPALSMHCWESSTQRTREVVPERCLPHTAQPESNQK